MITTANRIFVHPDFAEPFEQTFRTRARLIVIDRMLGFVSNQLLRPVNPDDPCPARRPNRALVAGERLRGGRAELHHSREPGSQPAT
jgi:hypothetical protein